MLGTVRPSTGPSEPFSSAPLQERQVWPRGRQRLPQATRRVSEVALELESSIPAPIDSPDHWPNVPPPVLPYGLVSLAWGRVTAQSRGVTRAKTVTGGRTAPEPPSSRQVAGQVPKGIRGSAKAWLSKSLAHEGDCEGEGFGDAVTCRLLGKGAYCAPGLLNPHKKPVRMRTAILTLQKGSQG